MATVDSTITYKDIPGFPGYRVGDDGSVWSRRRRGERLCDTWKQLKPGHSGFARKYRIICLKRPEGGYTRWYVHRLVLTTFRGECPAGMQGCHNDGNAANNHLSNLRWDTPKANQADRTTHGTSVYGTRQWCAKLDAAIVRRIRADRVTGMTFKQLSAKYDIATTTACKITRRVAWKQVT